MKNIIDSVAEKIANIGARNIKIKKPDRKPSMLMQVLNDPDNCNINISIENEEIVIRIRRKEEA